MLSEERIREYIEEHIQEFHQNRLARLRAIRLKVVLKRKNPYLFRAKNMTMASELVESIFAAHLSSSEETLFGVFLENLACFVCEQTYGGRRSATRGIDLEFERDGVRYFVTIKSGPNWGNTSQKEAMRRYFATLKKTLQTHALCERIVLVEGSCYGKGQTENMGDFIRLRGQSFGTLISGNENLYIDIIEPLGHRAKERNDAFKVEYTKMVNRSTGEFIASFCAPDGSILWEKLLQFNSGARTTT